MIYVRKGEFQVILWREIDRSGDVPALHLDFDTAEEAREALEHHRAACIYRAGLALQWMKNSDIWNLLDLYP